MPRDWRDPALLPGSSVPAPAAAPGSGTDDSPAQFQDGEDVVERGGATNQATNTPEPAPLTEVPVSGHLHVLVESASGLPDKTHMLSKDKPNPLAEVTILGSTFKTKGLAKTNSPKWQEELVWESVTVGGALEPTFPIAVQVFSEGFGRTSLIGSATCDVSASSLKDAAQELKLDLAPKPGKKQYASAGKIRLRLWIDDNSGKGGEEAAAAGAPASECEAVDEDASAPDSNELDFALPDEIMPGQWGVNVCVFEAKDIRCGDPNGCRTSVSIKCGGDSVTSKIAPQGVSAVFHESFQFSTSITSPVDFQALSVSVSIDEEHTFTRREIGTISLPLAFLYAHADQRLKRRWVALVDTASDGGVIAALLLVSISVTSPGQSALAIDEDRGGDSADSGDEDEAGDLSGKILMPPTLERVGCVLNVAVFCALGLPQMDFTVGTALGQTAGIDAYVRVRFAGGPWARTKIVKSRSPEFHQLLALPVVLPSMEDEIEVQVCDGDVMDADDVVGR